MAAALIGHTPTLKALLVAGAGMDTKDNVSGIHDLFCRSLIPTCFMKKETPERRGYDVTIGAADRSEASLFCSSCSVL